MDGIFFRAEITFKAFPGKVAVGGLFSLVNFLCGYILVLGWGGVFGLVKGNVWDPGPVCQDDRFFMSGGFSSGVSIVDRLSV